MILEKRHEALLYHAKPKPGKIEVLYLLKNMLPQHDLALAYSPGVAEPCLEIVKDKNKRIQSILLKET